MSLVESVISLNEADLLSITQINKAESAITAEVSSDLRQKVTAVPDTSSTSKIPPHHQAHHLSCFKTMREWTLRPIMTVWLNGSRKGLNCRLYWSTCINITEPIIIFQGPPSIASWFKHLLDIKQ